MAVAADGYDVRSGSGSSAAGDAPRSNASTRSMIGSNARPSGVPDK
jgi:hypothetical protein